MKKILLLSTMLIGLSSLPFMGNAAAAYFLPTDERAIKAAIDRNDDLEAIYAIIESPDRNYSSLFTKFQTTGETFAEYAQGTGYFTRLWAFMNEYMNQDLNHHSG